MNINNFGQEVNCRKLFAKIVSINLFYITVFFLQYIIVDYASSNDIYFSTFGIWAVLVTGID